MNSIMVVTLDFMPTYGLTPYVGIWCERSINELEHEQAINVLDLPEKRRHTC